MSKEAERLLMQHLLIQSTILGGILNIQAIGLMSNPDIATIVNENNGSLEILLDRTNEYLRATK